MSHDRATSEIPPLPELPDVSVVVVAFNEVSTIRQTIVAIIEYFDKRGLRCEVVAAIDGNDGTREIVSGLSKEDGRIRLLGGEGRRGKGVSIREAILQAEGRIIGFLDGDNKVPITEFEKLEGWLRSGCEVVIGSRGLPTSIIERNQRWVRQVGSRIFAFVMHAVIGLHDIVDTQCGFKFFRRDAAVDLFARQKVDGYMFDVEILLLAKQAGYCVKEVPIRWRDDHDSRLNLFAGNFRNGFELLSIWWRLGKDSSARGAVRGQQAGDAFRGRTDTSQDEDADPRPD